MLVRLELCEGCFLECETGMQVGLRCFDRLAGQDCGQSVLRMRGILSASVSFVSAAADLRAVRPAIRQACCLATAGSQHLKWNGLDTLAVEQSAGAVAHQGLTLDLRSKRRCNFPGRVA